MEERKREQDLGYKIRIIHNNIDRYFKSCCSKDGIEPTRMQCATMHYLENHVHEDVFQKDLEAEFSISGATATNILKIMEKEGLISRIPMPNDARLKKIELTKKGHELNKSAYESILRFEEGMKKDFSEEEITRFCSYLDRAAQNIVDLVEKNIK